MGRGEAGEGAEGSSSRDTLPSLFIRFVIGGDCSAGFCSNLVIVEKRRRFWKLYVDGRDVPRAKCPMKMQYTRLLLSARSSA